MHFIFIYIHNQHRDNFAEYWFVLFCLFSHFLDLLAQLGPNSCFKQKLSNYVFFFSILRLKENVHIMY